MDKMKYKLFPTLVTKYKGILLPNEIETLHQFCINYESSEHAMITNGSKSSHTEESKPNYIFEILEDHVPGLKDRVESTLNDYAYDFGIGPVRVTNSWFNVQTKDSTLKQHCHPFSAISAALYLNVDENSSKLFFENPNQHIHYSYYGRETSQSEYLFEHYYVTPDPGDLVVFPSWLKHGSFGENNQTSNRTVISLNTSRY